MAIKIGATQLLSRKKNIEIQPRTVCMHVLGVARTDGRVKRAAQALQESGLAVTIVDVETEHTADSAEDLPGVRLRHIIMPPSFATTRFRQHMLARVFLLLWKSLVTLLKTRADIYHAHDVS